MVGLALLLLAPLGVSRSLQRDFSPGLPGVRSGDEPHYLVLINSVISDGDFDLANNYRDMHRGGPQAGRVFAGRRSIIMSTGMRATVSSSGGKPTRWIPMPGRRTKKVTACRPTDPSRGSGR